jgi:hypothetical protein
MLEKVWGGEGIVAANAPIFRVLLVTDIFVLYVELGPCVSFNWRCEDVGVVGEVCEKWHDDDVKKREMSTESFGVLLTDVMLAGKCCMKSVEWRRRALIQTSRSEQVVTLRAHVHINCVAVRKTQILPMSEKTGQSMCDDFLQRHLTESASQTTTSITNITTRQTHCTWHHFRLAPWARSK